MKQNEIIKNDGRKSVIYAIIAIAGAFAGLFAAVMLNKNVLPLLPQPWKAISAIAVQWIPAAIPLTLAGITGDKPFDLGFRKDKIAVQLLIGAGIGAAMSLVLTVIPVLCGFKNFIGSGKDYTEAWMFLYELVFCVAGVAFSEELVFRGIIFHKAYGIRGSEKLAVILSSAAFGLFHIFGGNIIQIFMTALLGVFWCVCRLKIKNCSTLSLIIAHGLYDALITFWCAVL